MSGKPVSSASLELEQKWVFSLNLPFANEKTIELATSFQTSPLASSTTSFVTVKANYNDSNDSHNSLSVTPEFESLLDVSKTVESSQTSCWKFMSPEGRKLESFILLKLSYRPAWQAIPEYTKSKRRRYLSKLCCRSKNRNEEEQVWEIYTTKNIVKTERRQLNIRGIGNCQAIQIFLKPLFDRYEDNQLQGRMNPPQKYQASLSLHKRRLGQQRSDWTRFSEPADNAGTHSSNHIVLTFAIPINGENSKRDPPLLWKVSLPRFQSTDISLDHLTVFDGSVDLREQSSHAYVQGYQSWSFTGSVGKGSNQPQPALPNMFSKAFNYGGTTCDPPTTVFPMKNFRSGKIMRENFCYKSDFFACITSGRGEVLDEFGGPALVCGWLSQHSQLGIVTIDETLKRLEMHATHKAQLVDPVTTTDWAYAQLVAPQLYDEEPMLHFLHAAAAFNQARPMQMGPLSTGWCSWYHYYENISTRNLRENFSKLTKMKKKVPTNIVVVDDGYMTAWGDWDSLKPKKFTDMALVSQDITEHGMKPGLWLAPFTCDKHSKLAKKHPEWIIRNDEGRPANSSNCGKFFYGLDATNPQVREYVFNCVQRAVKDWGFNVLKIDFLYAACLEGNGKYDLSVTRAQAMHMALQTIREAAGPDVFLIGCGCPIGVGIGYVDGMRVSADTGPTWYPSFPLPWYDNGTLPSLRAMIRNSMSRASFGHRWWHNDPDCLLLGKTTSLTNDEVTSAATVIAMTCGMLLLSDDLTQVDLSRMRMLTKIFPMTGVTSEVLDLHSTENQGMPSMMRLWCTDKYNAHEQYRQSVEYRQSLETKDYNAEATYFAKKAAFDWERKGSMLSPNERKRSCISVATGLGTWTILSLSNWSDGPKVMQIPLKAIEWTPEDDKGSSIDSPPSLTKHGWHLFSFWSGKYFWISSSSLDASSGNTGPLSRHLMKHQTEIFHAKMVTPNIPQYIGSDLHFSCGHEVLVFDATQKNKVTINLKTELNRVGHVYIFLPTMNTTQVRCFVAELPGRWIVVGSTPTWASCCCGRVIRIMVVVHADGSKKDGEIVVEF